MSKKHARHTVRLPGHPDAIARPGRAAMVARRDFADADGPRVRAGSGATHVAPGNC
jgi:hypothetical protein